MKNQALFSSQDKSKKIKCHLLQFLFGALRVSFEQQVPENQKSIKSEKVSEFTLNLL